jgi:hypothetical protein
MNQTYSKQRTPPEHAAPNSPMTVRDAAASLGIPIGRLYRAIQRGQVRVAPNRHNARASGEGLSHQRRGGSAARAERGGGLTMNATMPETIHGWFGYDLPEHVHLDGAPETPRDGILKVLFTGKYHTAVPCIVWNQRQYPAIVHTKTGHLWFITADIETRINGRSYRGPARGYKGTWTGHQLSDAESQWGIRQAEITAARERALADDAKRTAAIAERQRQLRVLQGWLKLTPTEFEHECARRLRDAAGFDGATVTRASGDGGVDIIATIGENRYAVQCKKYSGVIDPTDVRALAGVVAAHGYAGGIFMTTGAVTQATLKFAKQAGLRIYAGQTLVDLALRGEPLVAPASRSDNSRGGPTDAAGASANPADQNPLVYCPKCGKRNRVSYQPSAEGVHYCGACHTPLVVPRVRVW